MAPFTYLTSVRIIVIAKHVIKRWRLKGKKQRQPDIETILTASIQTLNLKCDLCACHTSEQPDR